VYGTIFTVFQQLIVNLTFYNLILATYTIVLFQLKVKQFEKPWFTNNIKLAIIKRNEAYQKWKRYKTPQHHSMFVSLRKTVTKLIKSSSQTWKQIKALGIGKPNKSQELDVDIDELNLKLAECQVSEVTTNTYLNSVPENICDTRFRFMCVDQCDVLDNILKIKSNAIGPDDIHPKFIKILLPKLIPYLTHTFNTALTTSTFPDC